jgi:hypothetical protein
MTHDGEGVKESVSERVTAIFSSESFEEEVDVDRIVMKLASEKIKDAVDS